MKIPSLTNKSPTKQQLINSLIAGKWFGLADIPFNINKVSFEKRYTAIIGRLGEKKRVQKNGRVTVYFYVSAVNLVNIQLNAEYPEHKVSPPKQKITPYKLKPEDKMFNLMMGA